MAKYGIDLTGAFFGLLLLSIHANNSIHKLADPKYCSSSDDDVNFAKA